MQVSQYLWLVDCSGWCSPERDSGWFDCCFLNLRGSYLQGLR